MRSPFAALALVLAAGSGSAQSVIWTVDDGGGPGVAFTDIQPAVNAAGEGDTIFVRDGAYSGFTIDGKSLVVAGELGGTVLVVDEQILVRNLSAGQFVLLQGIEVEGEISPAFLSGQPALLAENNQGLVRVEDGSFLPSAALSVGGAVWVDGCAAVHLARCDLVGGQAGIFPPGLDGFPALDVLDGTVALYDCDLESGVAVQVDAGTFQPVGLEARSLAVTSPVASGATITVDGVGSGGDTVFLLVSATPGHLVVPSLFGLLTTDLSFSPISLGLLPPSGIFSLSVPTVPLPPSGLAFHLFLQTVSVAATGEVVLGSFATLVLLT